MVGILNVPTILFVEQPPAMLMGRKKLLVMSLVVTLDRKLIFHQKEDMQNE